MGIVLVLESAVFSWIDLSISAVLKKQLLNQPIVTQKSVTGCSVSTKTITITDPTVYSVTVTLTIPVTTPATNVEATITMLSTVTPVTVTVTLVTIRVGNVLAAVLEDSVTLVLLVALVLVVPVALMSTVTLVGVLTLVLAEVNVTSAEALEITGGLELRAPTQNLQIKVQSPGLTIMMKDLLLLQELE